VIIGLTGGIASGKTTVGNMLKNLGAEVISADKINHRLLQKGEKGWKRVVKEFGREILQEDNEIDRTYLGKIVFNDSDKRKKLEELTHPLIMEEIEKFERLNKVGEEIGAEMEDLSDKLDEAVAKTKSSEYTKAAELANKGKSASKEKIETKIEEMRKNLSMILEDEIHIDEDAQDKLEDLLAKSLNRLNSENYIQAHSVLEDAKEELKQSRATSAEKRIKELSEFLSILEEDIDTEKVDINSYKEYIKEAKKNLSEDKYEITLNKIDELKTNLNEELKEETEQVFGRAKMEVIRAKKTGVDIESFRKNLIKCKKNMKQDDYIEAIRVSHETEKRAKKEREMRKRAYESISDTASQLSTMKKEGRVDDISEIKETLVKAKNEFREKNYSDANETVKKANTMLEQRKGKSEFEEKKEALIEKIEKIKDQDHLTMETEEIEAELEQASNLVEKNKFSKAVEMAETADDLLEERLKENLEQLIAETKSDMKSAKKLGADMEGLDLEVSEAESSFGKERYFECLEILEEVEGKIEEYRGLHDSTAEKIEEVKEKILEAEQINAKIGDVRKLLDDAKTAFENHRYEQSLEKAEEANAIINKKIENKVDEIINEFEKKIDTYRSEEGDTTLADDFIQKAKKAKEDENYKEAINYSMQSEGELEKIELQQNIAHKSIAKAKQKMNKAEEKDLMIDQPKKILEESKNAYKSGFYVKAFDKAAKVSNELNEILECYEETEAFLKSIGDIIEEIKKEKENIDDLIEAKEQITNRFKNGDYKRAYSCLDEIENVLEKKTVKEVIERLQKEIESVPDEEERREVKKVLEDASTTLDIQGSLKAINLISKAKEISGVRKKEKYENTINEVENLVDKAKKFGASVKGVENKIDTAKGLKDEDKIDEASKKAKEALDQVEETLEDYSPKIEIKMPEDLKLNEWNDSKILFKNKGNGVAQSPEIEIYGGETEGFKLQDKLKAGEKTEISGRIKPTSEKAYIIARAVRIFDKKEIEEEYELQFTDEIKKEEIKNEKLCEICEKVVKGSEEMITCSCGSAFHESCIDEKKECPSCGVDIKSEAEENKDQRRVGMDI